MSTILSYQSFFKNILVICALLSLTACSGVETKGISNEDPYENFNRKVYNFNDDLDRAVLKPVANGYTKITPQPIRRSITNFFDNLFYINTIFHGLLQGKVDQALSDSVRFVYNSTLGIGGLFDVSTAFGIPKHDEDFGQTLATWGIEQGPYAYIPLLGPDTTRNTPDLITQILLNPLTYVSGGIAIPVSAIGLVNTRADLLDETQIRDDAAVDPYLFTREAFLQQREFLIFDGNPPVDEFDDIFDDDDVDSSALSVE